MHPRLYVCAYCICNNKKIILSFTFICHELFLRNFGNEEEEEDVHGHENTIRKLAESFYLFHLLFVQLSFGGLCTERNF